MNMTMTWGIAIVMTGLSVRKWARVNTGYNVSLVIIDIIQIVLVAMYIKPLTDFDNLIFRF